LHDCYQFLSVYLNIPVLPAQNLLISARWTSRLPAAPAIAGDANARVAGFR
jgi:hypothetical protein